jgi:hypothetical protein
MMILVICFICCVVCRVGDRSGRSRSNEDLADAVLYVLSTPPHVQVRKTQLNVFAEMSQVQLSNQLESSTRVSYTKQKLYNKTSSFLLFTFLFLH